MIEKEQLAALAALEIPIARAGCLKAKSKFPPRPLEFRAFSGRKTARGLHLRLSAAAFVFWIPGMREVFSRIGLVDCDERNMRYHHSVCYMFA